MKLEPQRLSGGLHLWNHEEPFSISVSALLLQQQSAAFCCLIHGDGGEGLRLGVRFKEESVGADQETGLLCLHQNSDGPQWTSCSVQACFDANTPRICTSAVVAIGQGYEVQSGSYQSCFNGFLLSLPATSSPCRHQLPPKVGVAVGKINLYELTSYLAHGTLNFWRNPQFQSPTLNLAVSFYFLWQVLTAYFSSPSVRVFLTTIYQTFTIRHSSYTPYHFSCRFRQQIYTKTN